MLPVEQFLATSTFYYDPYFFFKPGTRGLHAWFLEIALVHALVYVCVCVSVPRALITSGMMWCDIYRV